MDRVVDSVAKETLGVVEALREVESEDADVAVEVETADVVDCAVCPAAAGACSSNKRSVKSCARRQYLGCAAGPGPPARPRGCSLQAPLIAKQRSAPEGWDTILQGRLGRATAV